MSDKQRLQYVYMLVNPVNQMPFYVGITSSTEVRFSQHIESQQGKMRASIVRYITERGLAPAMVVLERKPDRKRARLSEIFWIELLASRGIPIVNKEVLGGIDAVAFHQSGIREQDKRHREESKADNQLSTSDNSQEKPKNHGKSWSEEEVTNLVKSFLKGESCESLALIHGRTEAGILGRLEKVSRENAAVYDRMAALSLLPSQISYQQLGS